MDKDRLQLREFFSIAYNQISGERPRSGDFSMFSTIQMNPRGYIK